MCASCIYASKQNGLSFDTFQLVDHLQVYYFKLWLELMNYFSQTCGGAVILTDIVFWCVIVPFLSDAHVGLNLVRVHFWKPFYCSFIEEMFSKLLMCIFFPLILSSTLCRWVNNWNYPHWFPIVLCLAVDGFHAYSECFFPSSGYLT